MNKKKTGLLLSILGVVSLVLITAGVTYAFFSYTKEGTQTNAISTGSITFRYSEDSAGLALTNALPMSDANGITKTTRNENPEAFEFSVTSTTPSSANIPYVVTIRSVNSTLPDDQVKIYLTDDIGATGASAEGSSYTAATTGNPTVTVQNGNNKTYTTSGANTTVKTYSQLPTSSSFGWYNDAAASRGVLGTDKIIYEGIVPAATTAGSTNSYTRNFTLGMWLKLADSGMADYSAYEFVRVTNGTTTIDDTNGTSVATLETNGDILTSTEYYRRVNLTAGNADKIDASDWVRIKYRNYNAGLIITTETSLSSAPEGFENANEQYYPLNGKTFNVRVNVYAEGATVYAN